MNRKAIYTRINDLLDQCKKCPQHKRCNNTKPSIICGDCRIYIELRKLGDSLIHDEESEEVKTVRKELLKDLTVDRYLEAIHSYPTKSKAALALGATYQVLSNWEKKHESQIKLATSKKHVDKASETKDQQPAADKSVSAKTVMSGIRGIGNAAKTTGRYLSSAAKKNKLMASIDDLTTRLKAATEQQKKLVQENEWLKDKLEKSQAERENLNNETANLKSEINQLKLGKQDLQKKYTSLMENYRHVSVDYCEIKGKYDEALPILLALEEFSVKMIKTRQHLDKIEIYGVDKDVVGSKEMNIN